jgi:GNAT superfamily N-acetyltransferase
LPKKHDRGSFVCGEPALNEFLQRHARQSHDKGAAKTFLAVSKSDGRTILGFYSLCPASLEYASAPEIIRRGMGRHDIPVFRLARLAVSRLVQGHGLGGQLILAAGRRSLLAAEGLGDIRRGGRRGPANPGG